MSAGRVARIAAAALALAALAGVSQAAADAPNGAGPTLLLPDPGTPDHPYLFTQEHRDDLWWWNGTWLPQSVLSGALLRIQLPGGPAIWHPVTGLGCHPTGAANLLPLRAQVTQVGRAVLPNEERIDGYSDLQQFDFRVAGVGPAAVCLRADPAPAHPEDIGLPPGVPVDYVLTVLVGIPQASLPSL